MPDSCMQMIRSQIPITFDLKRHIRLSKHRLYWQALAVALRHKRHIGCAALKLLLLLQGA
jgi:hypothetical protein